MQNRNRLADRAKLADGLLIYKNNPIHICNRHDFCQYHLTLKKIIKNIKQHFKIFYRSSISPTNQDLSNDTTFSQIKSRVPVPLRDKEFNGLAHCARLVVHIYYCTISVPKNRYGTGDILFTIVLFRSLTKPFQDPQILASLYQCLGGSNPGVGTEHV